MPQSRGRRSTSATTPSRSQSTGRGYQREAWLKRVASVALPVRSGNPAKSRSIFFSILASRSLSCGWSNSRCQSVGEVHTWRIA